MSKIEKLKNHYKQIIEEIGEDPEREGLVDTPKRAAKAMDFLTRGYQQDVQEVINNALFASDSQGMITVKDIEFYSMCEHHMLPFFGKAHIGYIPDGKVLGLSKVARIVDVFARRLQIQERLTQQVADTILDCTGAKGVGVVLDAQHMCMMMRGVVKQNPNMKTSAMLGSFLDNVKTRNEFLYMLQ